MTDLRCTHSAACVRSVTPMAWKIRLTWFLTVFSEMPSVRAITLLEGLPHPAPCPRRRAPGRGRAPAVPRTRSAHVWLIGTRRRRRERSSLGSPGMWDPASSPLRGALAVVAAAGGTTLLWTLVTGDLNEAAGYGLVVVSVIRLR